jgi:thiamine pyrophosphokinase
MGDEEKIDYFVDYAISNGALQGGYAQYEKLSPEQKAEVAIQGMNAIFQNDDLPDNIMEGDYTSLWFLTEDEIKKQMKAKSLKDQKDMTDNSRAFLMQ